MFVCSGDNQFGIVPFIKFQLDGIINKGNQVDFFPISGSGKLKYLSNVLKLKKHLIKNILLSVSVSIFGVIGVFIFMRLFNWESIDGLLNTFILLIVILFIFFTILYGVYLLFNIGPIKNVVNAYNMILIKRKK